MDTAANASGFAPDQSEATAGFAIPINHAISIANADQRRARRSSTVHIGLGGFLGVKAAAASDPTGCAERRRRVRRRFGGYSPPVSSGALICQVYPGTPAQAGGLASGDVITSVNGKTVASSDALTSLMAGTTPATSCPSATWTPTAPRHQTSVTLSEMAK